MNLKTEIKFKKKSSLNLRKINRMHKYTSYVKPISLVKMQSNKMKKENYSTLNVQSWKKTY